MIKKVVFDKALKRALNGEKVSIISSRSVTKKEKYIFNRGCRYFIRAVHDAYEIGLIKDGVFEVQNRFTFVKYSDPSEYNRLLELFATRFQLDEQDEYVFVRAVFSTENEYVDKEQLLAMIHAHQLEEISRSSYSDKKDGQVFEMCEIYYRVDMMYLFKLCKALPDFRELKMLDGGKSLLKSGIQLEIDIDAAACDFYQN
ncbi:hypothetical protein ACOMCU_01395 [Lysinibacillus sp. UGB7]|uniref:hypothetical protein n=1 Tax=Lysinibacillus TaxID=400634 RepID=UPI0018CF2C75|nr:hypothetical protein [Lysinibacillus sphaericus]MBG9693193.1 hypothetical protein [Lysinibacillus sphaericus]